MKLTDANGEERKGIEVDMLADDDDREYRIRLYEKILGTVCLCLVDGFEIGLSDREKKTIRDLMLAGF